MEDTGLYFICDEVEELGFGISLSYNPEDCDLQFAIFFGCYVFAIGYIFGYDEDWY